MFLEEQKKNHVEVKLDYCFLAVSKCYSVGFGILLLCLFFFKSSFVSVDSCAAEHSAQ